LLLKKEKFSESLAYGGRKEVWEKWEPGAVTGARLQQTGGSFLWLQEFDWGRRGKDALREKKSAKHTEGVEKVKRYTFKQEMLIDKESL